MSQRAKHFLLNILLVTSSVFLTIFVIEVSIWIYQNLKHRDRVSSIFMYDPVLGWKLAPNQKGFYNLEGNYIQFRTNSKGLRSNDYPYHKKKRAKRVLILGDSFVLAEQVNDSELFSKRMENELDQNLQESVEVINAGVSGYSTDQELIFFQREGEKYHPDLTILMFFGNDVWFNNLDYYGVTRDYYGTSPKPYFVIKDNKLRLKNVPVPKKKIKTLKQVAAQSGDKPFFQWVKEWLHVKSAVYRLIRKKIQGNIYFFNLASKLGISRKNIALPDQFWIWQKTADTKIQKSWIITERLLLELKSEVEGTGSSFFVFYIPNIAEIYPEHWDATKTRYGISDQLWDINKPGKDLKEICFKLKIDFINPFEKFRKKAKILNKKNKKLYYAVNSHWTPEGHKLAAEILSAAALKYIKR